MAGGAIAAVHCAGKFARGPTSPTTQSGVFGFEAAPRKWGNWDAKQHPRLGSLSLAYVASAVGGDSTKVLSEHETGKSSLPTRCGFGKQRWQQVRVGVRNPQASTARVQALGVDELQKQLESLQQEAAGVQYRASGARARFMRLSEAAEQLRLRAALDVKAGRDENAVRMLKEKQRVMQALEVSKNRAGVLEELYSKLNEAISMKETQLIAALSCARLDMSEMEVANSDGVRVVSSPEQSTGSKLAGSDSNTMISGLEQTPVVLEEVVEVTTDDARISKDNELNSPELSGQPESEYNEPDLPAQGSPGTDGAGVRLQLSREAENLFHTDVPTDGRGYSLVGTEQFSAGEGNGRDKSEHIASFDMVTVQEELLSGSHASLLEEDLDGGAGAKLGSEGIVTDGSAVGRSQDVLDGAHPVEGSPEAHDLESAKSVPNELYERKISEVKAELDGIRKSLEWALEFLDLEDTSGGALELQLTNLIKKRDVTRVMIMELFLGSKQSGRG